MTFALKVIVLKSKQALYLDARLWLEHPQSHVTRVVTIKSLAHTTRDTPWHLEYDRTVVMFIICMVFIVDVIFIVDVVFIIDVVFIVDVVFIMSAFACYMCRTARNDKLDIQAAMPFLCGASI